MLASRTWSVVLATALSLFGLVSPSLNACLCGLFSGDGPCCDEARAARADPSTSQLDVPPCCCCSEVAAPGDHPGPAPTIVVSASQTRALDAAPVVSYAADLTGAVASTRGARAPPEPHATPPPSLLVRRSVVLIL